MGYDWRYINHIVRVGGVSYEYCMVSSVGSLLRSIHDWAGEMCQVVTIELVAFCVLFAIDTAAFKRFSLVYVN